MAVRHYTGQEWDAEAGLYYYHARYYDPDLGLFLQPDPVMQFPSPYLYVGGNPVNRTDPTGMCYGEDCSYVKLPNTKGDVTKGYTGTHGSASYGSGSGSGSTPSWYSQTDMGTVVGYQSYAKLFVTTTTRGGVVTGQTVEKLMLPSLRAKRSNLKKLQLKAYSLQLIMRRKLF